MSIIVTNPLKAKRVLITGATGFIGANLVHKTLREDAYVSILTRNNSNKWRISDVLKDVAEYSVDLLDTEKLEHAIMYIKPEIIFHAAVYGGYPSQNGSSKILETNVVGTANLINACSKIDFELFVNTGSSSEYGIKLRPMKEDDVLEPMAPYGVSKASAALYCRAVALSYGRPVVTLRLFSPYGYYEDSTRLIPSVVLSCLRGENPKVSSSESVRDFVFIEDITDVFFKAVENHKNIVGQIFNVGYGKQHTVGQVVTEIIELTAAAVKPEWNSIGNPRIEPKVWQADISKARKLLNWQPAYSLTMGLEKTINWFRENMHLYAN